MERHTKRGGPLTGLRTGGLLGDGSHFVVMAGGRDRFCAGLTAFCTGGHGDAGGCLYRRRRADVHLFQVRQRSE